MPEYAELTIMNAKETLTFAGLLRETLKNLVPVEQSLKASMDRNKKSN